MVVPPSDEGREVLQPSLLPVPGHSVSDLSVEASPCDQHCVSDGVRDSAGIAEINNVTNIVTTSVHLLYSIFKQEAWLLGPVRFDQSGCPAHLKAATSSHEVCAAVVGWSPGHVISSIHIQNESPLPGVRVGAPPDAAFLSKPRPCHPDKTFL